MNALTLQGVTKTFGDTAVLGGVDLTVPEGAVVALLGVSGSGKSTLLRVVAGFERADSGSVSIAEEVVDDATSFVPAERRRIGFVPQDGSLFPHLSVEKNVLFGLPRRRRRSDRADELLAMVGLEGFNARRPTSLSGGQRQRVAVARALATEPALLLLDEPFGALDEAMRADVRDEVVAILRHLGATAILVTHDQDEALSVADRVAVLRETVIVQVDEPEVLYTRPADTGLAQFLGDANVLDGMRHGLSATTTLGEIPLDPMSPSDDGPVKVVLRPEQLGVVDVGRGRASVVTRHRYFGHDAMTEVHVTDGPDLNIRHEPSQRLHPGDEIGVAVIGQALAFSRRDALVEE